MIVLVSGGTATHRRYWDNQSFGFLLTPRSGNSVKVMSDSGKPWAADNDAFGGWSRKHELRFSAMLGRMCLHGNRATCKFVVAPDVVADARITLEQFAAWEPFISGSGFPVALVAQDGLTIELAPWNKFDALFIGGTTEFKVSLECERLCIEAKRLGKWLHIGRVNTFRRVRHFHEIGVDSIDGTCFSKWPDVYFPKFLKWLEELNARRTFDWVKR